LKTKEETMLSKSFISRCATLGGFAMAAIVCALPSLTRSAQAKTSVVAAIPELAAIAKEVGGDEVEVYSIAKPNQDYHAIETRPSDVARLSRAKLVVRVGLGLDPWMVSLSGATGNTAIQPGGASYVDASDGVPLIEVPNEQITGASGDVHPQGNPHYYYDPTYAVFAARNITRGLVRVDAAHADAYRAGYARFRSDMLARLKGWQGTLAPYQGKRVVTYHRNYNYFLRRFGIVQGGTMEPRPGIPPSARHINALLTTMKGQGTRGILIEGIYPLRYPNLVAKSVGSRVVVGPYSVATLDKGAYAAMMDKLVDAAKQALSS
jgi:zinc/manganese transport system substrate-binding protein